MNNLIKINLIVIIIALTGCASYSAKEVSIWTDSTLCHHFYYLPENDFELDSLVVAEMKRRVQSGRELYGGCNPYTHSGTRAASIARAQVQKNEASKNTAANLRAMADLLNQQAQERNRQAEAA